MELLDGLRETSEARQRIAIVVMRRCASRLQFNDPCKQRAGFFQMFRLGLYDSQQVERLGLTAVGGEYRSAQSSRMGPVTGSIGFNRQL
jgi:hypothetical protein